MEKYKDESAKPGKAVQYIVANNYLTMVLLKRKIQTTFDVVLSMASLT